MQEAFSKLQGTTGLATLNKLVSAYAHNGELSRAIQVLRRMEDSSQMPDRNTFLSLLALCADKCSLLDGRYVYSRISYSAYVSDDLVQNAAINMYGKCGSVDEARMVFQSMKRLTQPSWNSLLSAYVKGGRTREAFRIFQSMQLEGFDLDKITFVTILTSCSVDVHKGKLVHGYVVESGLESNVMVGTALMNMYGKCGFVEDARAVFHKLHVQDVVSWTSMILTYVQNDEHEEALKLFFAMKASGVRPNRITYATAISACTALERVEDGKLVHAMSVEDDLDCDVVVSCAIVNMYGKCGRLEEAQEAFDKMESSSTTISWNALVAAYTQHGHSEHALVLFRRMQLQGLKPDKIAFGTILTACADCSCLAATKSIHELMIEAGYGDEETLTIGLLTAYIKCNCLEETRRTFDRMGEMGFSNVNSCTRMIAAYVQHGSTERAFKLFKHMQLEGIIPDKITFITVLSACSSPCLLPLGRLIHSCILERGYQSDVVVGNCIMTMYSDCSRVEEAMAHFNTMTERDNISWNTVIGGHAQAGFSKEALQLFRAMLAEGIWPDKFTFISLIDSIGGSREAKFLVAVMSESGVELDGFLLSSLLNVHSKYGNLEEARLIFNKTTQDRDVVLWTSLITAYVQHGSFKEALRCSREMRLEGVAANDFTWAAILNACAGDGAISEGRLVHAHAVDEGYANSSLVGNAAVNMYAKCGCLEKARENFLKSLNRNLVSWNTMLAAYVHHERFQEALVLFYQMQLQGLKPDRITFATVLNGCPSLAAGRRIQEVVTESGWDTDHVVKTALLSMSEESIEEASRIFNGMKFRDIISWNSIITANVEHGLCKEAIKLFKDMQLEGVRPDKISFVTILNAYAATSGFKEAKLVEQQIDQTGFRDDITVANSVVSMHGRCGRLVEAGRVFESMKERDIFSWNVVVSAHAQHGHGEHALKLFRKMQQDSMKPDSITLTSVLSACSHVGLIEDGYYYFTAMKREYGVDATEEHYGCILDLLARAGRLEQAEEFISKMPVGASYRMWMTLLSACKLQGSEEIGKRAAERVMELDSKKSAPYIMLSCSYSKT